MKNAIGLLPAMSAGTATVASGISFGAGPNISYPEYGIPRSTGLDIGIHPDFRTMVWNRNVKLSVRYKFEFSST